MEKPAAAANPLIRAELKPRIGSVLLHSRWSGVSRICRNFDNRAGDFVLVETLVKSPTATLFVEPVYIARACEGLDV